MISDGACRHEWGVAKLALGDDSGDSIEVCLVCGELRYVSGAEDDS